MTHAPLGDCKKVLEESNWDIAAAQELLKERGILKAWKKWDRQTNEWVVKFVVQDWVTAWVKVLCETDFVAKNETFLLLIDSLLSTILATTETNEIVAEWLTHQENLETALLKKLQLMLDENVATVGESLRLEAVYRFEKTTYVYNHMWFKVSSVVFYEGWHESVAKAIALQVAAMNPLYMTMDKIPDNIMHEKKKELELEMESVDKPEDIKNKILEWKIFKAFQDEVLMEQSSIIDPTKKIKDMLDGTKVLWMMRVVIW